MDCTDCNGSGLYVGLGLYPAETCERCSGTGKEPLGGGATGATGPTKEYSDVPRTLTNITARGFIDDFWNGKKDSFPSAIRLVVDTKSHPGRHYFLMFNTPVQDTGTFYILVGHRDGGDLVSRLPKDMPNAVALSFAQQHHLALYERLGADNYFFKIWSA